MGILYSQTQFQNYLSEDINSENFSIDSPEFEEVENQVKEQIHKILSIKGKVAVDQIHRKLGQIMFKEVAMSRNEKGLLWAIEEIKKLREEFWTNVAVSGDAEGPNSELEKAGRLADYLEDSRINGY